SNLGRLIAADRNQLSDLYLDIRDANRRDYDRYFTIREGDLDRLQRQLPPGVLLVEYSPQQTALAILLVTHHRMCARAAPVARRDLDALVRQLGEEIRFR